MALRAHALLPAIAARVAVVRHCQEDDVNAYRVENRIRAILKEVRRARLRSFACVAAATALAMVGLAGIVVSARTQSTEAVAVSLVGWGGATCFAAWGGWAMRGVARLERRIVQLVSAT